MSKVSGHEAAAATCSNPAKRSPFRLMFSLHSFSEACGETPPSLRSCILTGIVMLLFLFCTEQSLRYVLSSFSYLHPILKNPINRGILSRHIGVDALSCAIVVCMGWQARHIQQGVLQTLMPSPKNRSFSSKVEAFMPAAAHEQRMYTYHPASFRISLFFFMYQIKNLYDTIVWNDGPEFIFHHIFSSLTAWGAMYPGCGHFYCIFFFGMCEVSTCVLCLLANFDEVHGVAGLGEAVPNVKLGLGLAFVVLFIICRCILWPVYSYYFARDVLMLLKGNDERTKQRKLWLKFFLVSLSGLSVLQVAWLGQIFGIAKQELTKMGIM